jgi:hypothetical protein
MPYLAVLNGDFACLNAVGSVSRGESTGRLGFRRLRVFLTGPKDFLENFFLILAYFPLLRK